MKIWRIKPELHNYITYGWAIVSQIVMSIIAIYSLRLNNIGAKVGLVGISLFLFRPLYRGFDTVTKRQVDYSDANNLYVRMGIFRFKIRKDRAYLSIENAPVMIYGPATVDTGYNVCLVRNDYLFVKKIIKNKIVLIHKKTLEEAEITMNELKELFDINDMYDVKRINYNKKNK